MKQRQLFAYAGALSCAILMASSAMADEIDWSMVPGSHGRNDVSRDFVSSPDNLNTILSNNFTAWYPIQLSSSQARTTTGRAQRRAVIGSHPESMAATENTSYTEQIVTSQSAPEQRTTNNEALSSEQQSQRSERMTKKEESSDHGVTSEHRMKNESASTGMSSESSKNDVQAKLVPHAYIIQSSLSSAMDNLKGMKNELDYSKSQSSAKKSDQNAISAYRTFVREIRKNVAVASQHEQLLVNGAKKYPDLANSSDLRDVSPAMRDLKASLSKFEAKANNPQYWSNSDQAKTDLNMIQRQLNNALDKVKSFSSGKLNA